MGSCYYSGATQFSLKLWVNQISVILLHRSKFPFKSIDNLAITAVSLRYPLPSTSTVILKPKCHILGLTYPCPPQSKCVCSKNFFRDFTSLWACLFHFKLLHLIHNSKGHGCSGLFCTKLQVLWLPNFVHFTSKTWNFIDFNKICL